MDTTSTTAGHPRIRARYASPAILTVWVQRSGPIDRGNRTGRRMIAATGSELRTARVAAGLSLGAVGRVVGLSHSQVGRIERGVHPSVSVIQLARIGSVVGLDISVRMYSNGSPLRDTAHLALLSRFRDRLPAMLVVRTEVPLSLPGDLRAWDLVVAGAGEPIAVEAETRLADIQALERRLALKARDSGMSRVLLIVSASRTNRLAIRESHASLMASFPVPGRAAMAALAKGRDPGGNALILM